MPHTGDERVGVLDARALQGGERRRCNNDRLHGMEAEQEATAAAGGGGGGGPEPQVGWAIITEEPYKK
jgi:hypothetical protein